MTELVLFAIVGVIAVAAAVLMLLSDNPVHSALFLIVTMVCIAFLFLLLNAPFLAMIQITVYTGAIMVLFLFVIMLLGAEKLQISEASKDSRNFPWYTPLAVGLIFALLLIGGIILTKVNLDLQPNPGAPPQLRIVNAAPDAGAVDVFANDQLVASGVAFNADASYTTLAAGAYTLKIQPAKGSPATVNVTLKNGDQQTLIDYGFGQNLQAVVVADNNDTVSDERSARLTFFDAYLAADTVQLVDFGSDFDTKDTKVIVDNLTPGQASAPLTWPEGTVNWSFVSAADQATPLFRLKDYKIDRSTSGLFVLTSQRIADGSANGVLRPLAIPVVTDARPSFGGPRAIGLQLFTTYMLAFQLLGVLLLAALVGAIVLTHRERKKLPQRVGGRRVVSRPLVNVIASQVGHEVSGSDNVPELQEPAGD
jgi:NADH:ubiquinone oxidoreductase subunit 6 (subunit J)